MTRRGPTRAEGVRPRAPRPTANDLRRAVRRRLRDVIGPGLDVLFVGINPGLYSAAVGHHFGRPGNRFWKALLGSGFTERLLSPFEDTTLPELGLGITNLCPRTTRGAEELTRSELRAGARALARKVRRHRPCVVAFLGLGAYRLALGRPEALPGAQPERLEGALVWVMPNPSGRNAHYPLGALVRQLRALRASAHRSRVASLRIRQGESVSPRDASSPGKPRSARRPRAS